MKLGSMDQEGCLRRVVRDGELLDLPPDAFGDVVGAAPGSPRQRANSAHISFPIGELLAEFACAAASRTGGIVLTETWVGVRTPPAFPHAQYEVLLRGAALSGRRNRTQSTYLAAMAAQAPH